MLDVFLVVDVAMFAEISFENGSKLGPKIKVSFFIVCVGLALSGALLIEFAINPQRGNDSIYSNTINSSKIKAFYITIEIVLQDTR